MYLNGGYIAIISVQGARGRQDTAPKGDGSQRPPIGAGVKGRRPRGRVSLKVKNHRIIMVRKIPPNIVTLRAALNNGPYIRLPRQSIHRHRAKIP